MTRSHAQAISQSGNNSRGVSRIADAANNPQFLVEARSQSNGPKWKEAMDCGITTLETVCETKFRPHQIRMWSDQNGSS
jgi:hypothetical protein